MAKRAQVAAVRWRSFVHRAIVAATILVVTLAVSAIWQKMVYTIPVLAVLLILAASIKDPEGGIHEAQP